MGILDKINKKSAKKEETKAEETKKVEAAPKKKQAEKKAETVQTTPQQSNAYKILIKPLLTEKALLGEANGVYAFVVAPKATKVDIKNAVRDVYGVMPKKVRVMNMDGKRVRFGLRKGRRQDWKKAIVALPKGKTIQIHEGV